MPRSRPRTSTEEQMRVLRQSCAGLVWSKQMYPYRVDRWLDGDPGQPPPPPGHRSGRNSGWRHLDSFDVLAMPDPWEYPWFAAWDLAFHTITWAHLDPAFAKYQLLVLLREWFLHPNGALPAYEWSFDDVNPPVHALAALRVFVIDGATDLDFLERVFQKLLLNFTWWLNRQDPDGNNIFGGGFLGLDNISPIDRSHLPPGFKLDQADGTAWMAYYSVAMLTLAALLAEQDSVYEDMVVKFLEQPVLIMDALEDSGCYDPDDGFFYDLLTDAFGNREPIKVQTLVGVIPALPAITLPTRNTERMQRLRKRFARRMEAENRHRFWTGGSAAPGIPAARCCPSSRRTNSPGSSPHCSTRMRSCRRTACARISKRHTTPYQVPGMPDAAIEYEPAESTHRDVWRQFQLAGTGVVPGQLPGHPGAAAVRPILRSRIHHRIPDRIRAAADSARRRRRPRRPAGQHLAPRPGRPAARLRRRRTHADRPGVEGQPAVLRVLPRRQRRRPRRHAPDRVDRPGRGPAARPTPAGAPDDLLRRHDDNT